MSRVRRAPPQRDLEVQPLSAEAAVPSVADLAGESAKMGDMNGHGCGCGGHGKSQGRCGDGHGHGRSGHGSCGCGGKGKHHGVRTENTPPNAPEDISGGRRQLGLRGK